MKVKIEKEKSMRLTGIHKIVEYNNSFEAIPPMWSKISEETVTTLVKHMDQKGIMGICGEFQEQTFTYMIGIDTNVDLNYHVIEVPTLTWAKFHGVGILPEGIQEIWTNIPEWFQENSKYQRINAPEIEVYSHPDNQNEDGSMYFEVWIAVSEQ